MQTTDKVNTSLRIPAQLLEQAEQVAAKLGQTAITDFGPVTRSTVLVRSIRLGLDLLDQQLKPTHGD